jgi:hypothetical protein
MPPSCRLPIPCLTCTVWRLGVMCVCVVTCQARDSPAGCEDRARDRWLLRLRRLGRHVRRRGGSVARQRYRRRRRRRRRQQRSSGGSKAAAAVLHRRARECAGASCGGGCDQQRRRRWERQAQDPGRWLLDDGGAAATHQPQLGALPHGGLPAGVGPGGDGLLPHAGLERGPVWCDDRHTCLPVPTSCRPLGPTMRCGGGGGCAGPCVMRACVRVLAQGASRQVPTWLPPCSCCARARRWKGAPWLWSCATRASSTSAQICGAS